MTPAAAGCHYFQAASILTLKTSICQPQITVPHLRKETKTKHFHSNSKPFDSHAEIKLSCERKGGKKPKQIHTGFLS